MQDLLRQSAEAVSLGLEFLALIVTRHLPGNQRRAVWLEFSHWLVAALTFQLAADIVQTMVVPGWEDIGRVAAIAVIRTFLTFFLDRDIDTIRERNSGGAGHAAGA